MAPVRQTLHKTRVVDTRLYGSESWRRARLWIQVLESEKKNDTQSAVSEDNWLSIRQGLIFNYMYKRPL